MNFASSVFHSVRKTSREFYNKVVIINIKLIRIVRKARTDFSKNPEDYAGGRVNFYIDHFSSN